MKVSVIGGGISGLTAAYYLSKLPKVTSITVYEASQRLGGWIQTTRSDDGFTFEHGPRTVRPAGPKGANTLELIEDLGIEDRIVPIKYGHPATVNRMVCVNGELHKLPSNLKSIFTTQPPFSKPLFLAGVKEFFTTQKKCPDESIYDFVQRRFGSDVAKFAIDPMVRGICAGDAKSISAKAFVAGPMFNLEQDFGSVFRGLFKRKIKGLSPKPFNSDSKLVQKARDEKWNVWSLEGGLETLTSKLSQRLQKDGVIIKMSEDTNLKAEAADKDFTFLSTPAYISANYLSNDNGLHKNTKELRTLLDSIPYVDVAVINFMFQGKHLIKEPAFGFLVPSSEKNVPILGVIYDTCSFPQGDATIFTVMMGGAWFNQLFGQNPNPKDLESIALEHLKNILKINDEPIKVICKVHEKCIAQYTVGHAQRVEKLRELTTKARLPIAFVGSAFDGVGLNDAIMSSKNEVCRLFP